MILSELHVGNFILKQVVKAHHFAHSKKAICLSYSFFLI